MTETLPQDPLTLLLMVVLLGVMVLRDVLRQRRESNRCSFEPETLEKVITRVLDARELDKLRKSRELRGGNGT